jgi:putative transposase
VRRIWAELIARGARVATKRVWRLMKAANLRGRHPRAWKKTTVAAQRPIDAPDLIGQNFTATEPNTRWCEDITYIQTLNDWVYTAILWNAPTSQSTESLLRGNSSLHSYST